MSRAIPYPCRCGKRGTWQNIKQQTSDKLYDIYIYIFNIYGRYLKAHGIAGPLRERVLDYCDHRYGDPFAEVEKVRPRGPSHGLKRCDLAAPRRGRK